MIGDSVFAHRNQEIKRRIEFNQKIKITNHAVTGHRMAQIAAQFERCGAKAGDVMVMDGGGNDIFSNAANCRNQVNSKCMELLDNITNEFSFLLEKMANRKISKVYVLSPYYTTGYMGSGYNKVIDIGTGYLFDACRESLVPCVFIDSRQYMQGRVYEWDGVHPNALGVKILADLISHYMKTY